MIGYIFRSAIQILKRKPFMLWGVSLLCGVITLLVQIGAGALPILSVPIVLTLEAGMSALYIEGYKGIDINSKQLFKGFTKECFPRVTAGMLWQYLWIIIWSFVPIMNIIKSYQYAFTPYILLTRPDVSPLDALKLSMKETEGYKARMFGASILMALILFAIILVASLVMIIPVIGWLVGFVAIVGSLILYPLFSGLVMAGFYEEAQRGNFKTVYPPYGYNTSSEKPVSTAQNVSPVTPVAPNTPVAPSPAPASIPVASQPDDRWACSNCGSPNATSANFCTRCGAQKNN